MKTRLLKIIGLCVAALTVGLSIAAVAPTAEPVHTGTNNYLLRRANDYLSGGVTTNPATEPVHTGLDNWLLRRACDYLQDSANAAVSWKAVVRVASTANGTISTAYANGQTVDGVVLATGDRILLKDQTSSLANGIYIVAASGSPARAADMDTWTEVVGTTVFAGPEGTTNKNTAWHSSSAVGGTLDSTAITFAAFGAGGGGGSGDALVANPLSQFASTTSAQLATVLSDETGSGGGFVRATSPTLTTPDLGTPSAAVLTNASGLPLAAVLSSTTTPLGAGSIELGHATDTTLARVSAGRLSVEGVNVVTISSTDTLTNKRISPRLQTITDASPVTATMTDDTVDLAILEGTGTGTITIAAPTHSLAPVEGQKLALRIKSTSARTLSFNAAFRFSLDMPAPIATSSSSLSDYMVFQWNATSSTWDAVGKNFGF